MHVLPVAVILGGGAGTRLYPLTKNRAKPAVPIGGAYRLVGCAAASVERGVPACLPARPHGIARERGAQGQRARGPRGGGGGRCMHACMRRRRRIGC